METVEGNLTSTSIHTRHSTITAMESFIGSVYLSGDLGTWPWSSRCLSMFHPSRFFLSLVLLRSSERFLAMVSWIWLRSAWTWFWWDWWLANGCFRGRWCLFVFGRNGGLGLGLGLSDVVLISSEIDLVQPWTHSVVRTDRRKSNLPANWCAGCERFR